MYLIRYRSFRSVASSIFDKYLLSLRPYSFVFNLLFSILKGLTHQMDYFLKPVILKLWNHLLIIKMGLKSSINFCSGVPSLLYWSIFSSVQSWPAFGTRITGGFRKQLIELQAAIRKPKKIPKEGCWKHFHNRKCFYRTKKNLYFGYFRQPNIVKTCSAHTKSTAFIFKTNIHLVTIPLK